MKKMKFYLIRHGESLGNINGSLTSTTDFELTEKGKIQAQRLGSRLPELKGKKVMAYSSTLLRAKQTLAEIISELSIKDCCLKESPLLKEMELGILECIPFQELKIKYPEVDIAQGLSCLNAPEGECYQDVKRRIQCFLEQCLSEATDQETDCILIVSHGITLRIMINVMLDRPDEDVNCLNWLENTALTELTYDFETFKFRVDRLNDYSHLKELGARGYEEWGLFADVNQYLELVNY